MLETLLKIGEWQSQGKSEWDRFLEPPKIKTEDKKGNIIKNYILPIIFDLDNNDIIVSGENLLEYDPKYLREWKAIKIQGGNNKAFYTTVSGEKIGQIYKTFFGKEGVETFNGELLEALKKLDSNLITYDIKSLLESVFILKDIFWQKFTVEKKNGERELKVKSIEEYLGFSNNQKLVLLTVAIKSTIFFGDSLKYFFEIPEFLAYLEKRFLKEASGQSTTSDRIEKPKLCYASGTEQTDVENLNLSSRFSLNKMFVEETKNYAANFDKGHFSKNYQVSLSNQEKLDYASNYLLNEGKLRVRIANIDHVIIPQFQEVSDIDMELTIDKIRTKSDLLFGLKDLEFFVENINDEVEGTYWLNFLAYESDGNFFKSTELIKDVSSFYFQKIIEIFRETHVKFLEVKGFDWNTIIAENGKNKAFNLNSVYSLIPVRTDNKKEKKNKVLALFKKILENREIEKKTIFAYYCELILCHYFERYKSFVNIPNSSSDYLYFSIRNSTFKYLAFIEVLKKLNLIDMNEENTLANEELGNKYDRAIHDFFVKMNFDQHQRAMFYLGRMLNTVEFIQKEKKKTVIQKVNFHGMDIDDIRRLRNSLVEKAKQYNKISKVIFTDRRFGELFDYNNWKMNPMNPQEAVFFLLTGYSFGISTNEAETLKEIEEDIN
jgi:CRISPR-associated protein Csh1